MTIYNRGDTELLECVLLARQVQAGTLPWQIGCKSIAQCILDERVSPMDACVLLAEVSESLSGPPELNEFEHLAHLREGREQFGYTSEAVTAEIFDACRGLISAAA